MTEVDRVQSERKLSQKKKEQDHALRTLRRASSVIDTGDDDKELVERAEKASKSLDVTARPGGGPVNGSAISLPAAATSGAQLAEIVNCASAALSLEDVLAACAAACSHAYMKRRCDVMGSPSAGGGGGGSDRSEALARVLADRMASEFHWFERGARPETAAAPTVPPHHSNTQQQNYSSPASEASRRSPKRSLMGTLSSGPQALSVVIRGGSNYSRVEERVASSRPPPGRGAQLSHRPVVGPGGAGFGNQPLKEQKHALGALTRAIALGGTKVAGDPILFHEGSTNGTRTVREWSDAPFGGSNVTRDDDEHNLHDHGSRRRGSPSLDRLPSVPQHINYSRGSDGWGPGQWAREPCGVVYSRGTLRALPVPGSTATQASRRSPRLDQRRVGGFRSTLRPTHA